MKVGDSGSRGATEVAMKAARQQPRRLRETVAHNVRMLTLRKRQAIGTNLGQNQRVMPMTATFRDFWRSVGVGKILIVVVIEL
jgi:hypothetical protein